MNFIEWLIEQKDRPDPVGDLSRDTKRAMRTFPNLICVSDLRSVMEDSQACPGAFGALEEAEREYSLFCKRMSGTSPLYDSGCGDPDSATGIECESRNKELSTNDNF